jgi:hypothetical protein
MQTAFTMLFIYEDDLHISRGEPSKSDINHHNLPAMPVGLPSIEIMFFFF